MPDATHDALREQVAWAIQDANLRHVSSWPRCLAAADAVLALFAERERSRRERIEALPIREWHSDYRADVLAVFEAERPQGRDAHRASGAQGCTIDRGAG